MEWWEKYAAIFFDLDGLLVNTEALHWMAYVDVCRENGVHLPWNFETYYSIASRSATGVHHRLAAEYPQLFEKKSWDELYEEKRAKVQHRAKVDVIPLMPGVEQVLKSLERASIPIAVVTHSPQQFVDHIRAQHPLFSVMQKWFTRESYSNPKPAPDGYRTAVDYFSVDSRKCVGFEDSLRGVEALLGANVPPILVQKYDEDARSWCDQQGIQTLSTIDQVFAKAL